MFGRTPGTPSPREVIFPGWVLSSPDLRQEPEQIHTNTDGRPLLIGPVRIERVGVGVGGWHASQCPKEDCKKEKREFGGQGQSFQLRSPAPFFPLCRWRCGDSV